MQQLTARQLVTERAISFRDAAVAIWGNAKMDRLALMLDWCTAGVGKPPVFLEYRLHRSRPQWQLWTTHQAIDRFFERTGAYFFAAHSNN